MSRLCVRPSACLTSEKSIQISIKFVISQAIKCLLVCNINTTLHKTGTTLYRFSWKVYRTKAMPANDIIIWNATRTTVNIWNSSRYSKCLMKYKVHEQYFLVPCSTPTIRLQCQQHSDTANLLLNTYLLIFINVFILGLTKTIHTIK